eukprot:gene14428-14223_t
MSSFVLAVIEDLGADLDPSTRYLRYVNSLAAALPGNACALLKKEGSTLKPLAVRGLTPDSLGRRFELNEHPRLNAIVTYRGVTHFPNKSTLPDPYDGLLEGVHAGDLNVHDCMGCALHVNGKLWGAITLDSLKAGVFDVKVERAMAMFARLGEAVVHVAELTEKTDRTATSLKLSQGDGNGLSALEAKLLRVLQSGQVQRVGSDREHRVDVRIGADSNRDLSAEVKAGRFRADLYHRLCAYPLHIPPLRERGDDVVLLAGYFLEQNRSRLGLRNLRLGRGCEAALKRYTWPGNVRELEHTLGRAALKARRDEPGPMVTVELEHLDLLSELEQERA